MNFFLGMKIMCLSEKETVLFHVVLQGQVSSGFKGDFLLLFYIAQIYDNIMYRLLVHRNGTALKKSLRIGENPYGSDHLV